MLAEKHSYSGHCSVGDCLLDSSIWGPEVCPGHIIKDMVPDLKAFTVQGEENRGTDNYPTGLIGYAGTEDWGWLEGIKGKGFTRINSHASR